MRQAGENRLWAAVSGSGGLLSLGIFVLVLGAYVIARAFLVPETVLSRLGVLLLLIALVQVVQGVGYRRFYGIAAHFTLALVYAGVAGLLLFFPEALLVAVTLVIGYALIAAGLVRVAAGALTRGLPGRFLYLAGGLLSGVVGVMLLLGWPSPSFGMVRMLIGVELVGVGIMTMLLALRVRRAAPLMRSRRDRTWVRMVKVATALVAALVFLVGVRLSLPMLFHRYAVTVFNELPGYRAAIGPIELHLLDGAFTIQGIDITSVADGERGNAFSVEHMVVALDLPPVLEGELIGSIALFDAVIRLVEIPAVDAEERAGFDEVLARVKRLAPFHIDRLDMKNATVFIADVTGKGKLDATIEDLDVVGRNMTNRAAMRETREASYVFDGSFMGAPIEGELTSNLLRDVPVLHLKAEVRDLPLTRLNPFLKAEYKLKAERGILTAYAEVTVEGVALHGYAKSFIRDLKVSVWPPPKEEKRVVKKVLRGIKEGLGRVGTDIAGGREGVIATEVPIRGELGGAELGLTSAVGDALRNAFTGSLEPGFKSDE